jgi:O-antigen ligase
VRPQPDYCLADTLFPDGWTGATPGHAFRSANLSHVRSARFDAPFLRQAAERSRTLTSQPWTLALRLVVLLWVAVLFDPHLWLATHGLEFAPSLPPVLFIGLAFVILVSRHPWVWYPPFLLFIANAAFMVPFAENSGVAFDLVAKLLLFFYILAIGSITFIRSVEKANLVLQLFLWQFLWWSACGVLWGFVPWHPTLGNEDSFGPLMVIGAPYCFYFGLASRQRGLRSAALFLAGVCLVGVVSSFARGAFLACAFVAVYVWARSSHKGRTAGVLILGALITCIAAGLLFPDGKFWHEMSTASDGFSDSTGRDRWILWKTAWRAFLERPVFGVGAGNFGIFSGANLWSDPELMAHYRFAGRLWGRVPHSFYFQTIAEFGLIGVGAVVALLADFWKRNTELRSMTLTAAWQSATDGRSDLRMLSMALEAAMVGYLATGIFYDQLYVHWFFSLVTLNVVVHRTARLAASSRQSVPVDSRRRDAPPGSASDRSDVRTAEDS